MPADSKNIVAVIPHWNRRDLLLSLFESLRAQKRPFDEIIVVDNGSTDDSVAIAQQAGARVIELGRNLGFAAAVNRGIQSTDADWVAILNNDVTLEPDWLNELLQGVNLNSDIWFATGKILSAGNPGIIDGTFDEIARSACACRCGAGKPDGPAWNQARNIRMAPMTAAIFRRDLFTDIGALDETFESYLEDVDFGLRCALHGREGRYVPSAVAHHRGSATLSNTTSGSTTPANTTSSNTTPESTSLGKWSPRMVFLISRNQVLLAAKYFRGQSRFPILAGQLLWGALTIRHGCGWAFITGKWAGLRCARNISSVIIGKNATNQLGQVLKRSEEQIRALGKQTGLDRYWRAYFWLSGQ